MRNYNPESIPDPEQWLSLDEQIRISMVQKYHRNENLPNIIAHSAIQVIVENQIASNEESVIRAMARVMSEGLSRHEALHAVGSVLAEHIHLLLQEKISKNNSAKIYNAALERLTVKSWKNG